MREFVYRNRIRVSTNDLASARTGKKTCTIRLGRASVAGTDLTLTDGREQLRVRVLRTDTSKTFGQLGAAEANGEGFSSVAELEADLRTYYRRIQADDPVTVIWFERLPGTPGA